MPKLPRIEALARELSLRPELLNMIARKDFSGVLRALELPVTEETLAIVSKLAVADLESAAQVLDNSADRRAASS